jgi:NAD(P)-dependent dehydrogenase (short-subunit alcohol dehydrogenase family)
MNKVLVITGGSKGIGWELCKTFLKNDWKVVSGSRNERKDLPSEIQKDFIQVKIDVTERGMHKLLVDKAVSNFGGIDCFINNAGFSEWRPIEKIDESFLDSILRTNLMGYFWGCQAAAGNLRTNGSIINISSLAAKRGTPNNSAYVASKFGVAGLTQSLAKELGPRGIRVNAVCPVLVETEGLMKALKTKDSPATGEPEAFLSHFAKSQTALGVLPTAAQVADLCLFLSSTSASAITGQSINVDCGVLPN